MKKILLFCLVTIISFSHGQKLSENKNKEAIISKALLKQLKEGYSKMYIQSGVEIPKNTFDKEELEITIDIVTGILKSNGYATPSKKEFYNKIKRIFYQNIERHSNNKPIYINFFIACDSKENYYPNNGVDYCGIYTAPKNKFISSFCYIPELIDYQKKYAEVAKEEKIFSPIYKDKLDGDIKIEFWKDVSDLNDQRKKNIQTIVARNKYLFNDDKSYFQWLTENDEYFMESLVKVFGYTEDQELLKWVVEKTVYKENDPQEYGKILWTKSCDGKLKIHNTTIKLFKAGFINKEVTKKHIEKYLAYLSDKKNTELNYLTRDDKNRIILAIKPLLE